MTDSEFTIERAIIMAAGKGTRLRPITFETPKPLIEVNGKTLIESIIDALHVNEIQDIIIVTGYMKDRFNFLKTKYPGITLVDNPYYDSSNNISSLYVVRDYIENTFIIDGDQMIKNPQVFNNKSKKSGYNCIWTKNKTDEWVLSIDENATVNSCSIGGNNGWQLYSISRWNKEDGMKLKRYVELEFVEKNNREIYWDNVALTLHLNDFNLGVTEMSLDDVYEIDSLTDLVKLDPSYTTYLNGGE